MARNRFMRPIIKSCLLLLTGVFLSGCGDQPSKAEVATRDNMHQFHSAMMDFREDTGREWPETIDDLKPYVTDFEEFMTNPITGDNPGYRYTVPDPQAVAEARAKLDEESGEELSVVVIVQLRNGEPDLSLRKLFSDGRVGH